MMSNDAPGIQQELKHRLGFTFELSEKIDTLTDGIRDMREGIREMREGIVESGRKRSRLDLSEPV
jgi:hypothetical protein